MTTVHDYIDGAKDDSQVLKKHTHMAGAAIAQFLVVRDGLRGRVPETELEATAGTLTAAILTNKP